MLYRREIDGLRGLAVLVVVLFHAGFQIFSGGFVGVDIFFVISGYLITTILINELQDGHFSIIGFYERRARRILPALFFVMLACLPFAWLWLFPKDLKRFTDSMLAVIFFLSNHLFSNQSSYFDSATELKPLLHTWSLSVEEQYYLLFPLILMFAWKLGQRWVLAILLAIIIASLLTAQWLSGAKPELAFYILPTRAWELLIGGLVALYVTNAQRWPASIKINQWGSALGMALIIYAIFVFNKQTPFPSFYTIIPTIGAALIILCSNQGNLIGRLLGHRILVGIGLISYSAYLWHQPLFAFTRYRYLEHPSQFLLGGLGLIAFILGYFTWKYIETPFRNKQRFNRRQIFTYSAIGCLVFIAIGLTSSLNKGFYSRLTDQEKEVLMYDSPDLLGKMYLNVYKRGACFLEPTKTAQDFQESCSGKNASDSVLIWGDSHAAALSFGIRQQFEHVTQYNSTACPPLIQLDVHNSPNCQGINDFVLQKISERPPKLIIMHANWMIYKKYDIQEQITKTIAAIKQAAPQSKVIIIGSVPQWDNSLPAFMITKKVGLDQEHQLINASLSQLQKMDAVIQIAAEQSQVTFVTPIDHLCASGKCIATTHYQNQIAMTAWDYGHLTEAGSALLATKLFPKK